MNNRGLRSALLFAFLFAISVPFSAVCQTKRDTPTFPSDSEIKLLLTQSSRAFDTYENILKLEEPILGKEVTDKDREVLTAARHLIRELQSNPQKFNGPYGFLLIINLDDASRNVAITGGQSAVLVAGDMLVGNTKATSNKMSLAQVCTDAQALIYTVAETATQKYQNYLVANALLQQQQMDAIDKCVGIIKNKSRK